MWKTRRDVMIGDARPAVAVENEGKLQVERLTAFPGMLGRTGEDTKLTVLCNRY